MTDPDAFGLVRVLSKKKSLRRLTPLHLEETVGRVADSTR